MFKILRSNKVFRSFFLRQYILGIETSCDDTGTAIIDDHGDLISEHLESQIKISSSLGGIIPTVARQLHLANIGPCVNMVMDKVNISYCDLKAIALTVKPGLGLSLGVGRDYAVSKGMQYKIPIIPIHHMEAHALMARMFDHSVEFPYLVLLISGGNSILAVVHSIEDFSMLGKKLDMSPGDCLDKIARMLKLVGKDGSHTSISGGRAIEILASENMKPLLKFEACRPQARDCNFSFTGLEGTVISYLERMSRTNETIDISQVCASVLYSMAFQMCRRIQRAMTFCRRFMQHVPTTLVVSGGVASNLYIRACFQSVCDEFDYRLVCPPVKYCTDNGVMIAWNGYELLKSGRRIVTDLRSIDYSCRAPFGINMIDEIEKSDIRLPKLRLKEVVFN